MGGHAIECPPQCLRERAGLVALAGISDDERQRLRAAAFEIAHPIVFELVTRRIARGRGHGFCGRGLRHLRECCLDGFHGDLEAVVDHLLTAARPIADLDRWIAGHATSAAIDGHRRRRAERGALQRPRMTKALAAGLDDDPWFCELALKILVWVGLPGGVGSTLWPLEAWAAERAARTGDLRGSTPARVEAEVRRVLAVMRRNPERFHRYVEAPLGRKIAPVGGVPGDGPGDPRPLVTGGSDELDASRADDLAGLAIEAIRAGLLRGEDATDTVAKVLHVLFVQGTGADEIDRVPGGGSASDARVSALLGDPATLAALVERIVAIVVG